MTYADHFQHIWSPAGLEGFLSREFDRQSLARELASDDVAYFLAYTGAPEPAGFAKLRYPRPVPFDGGALGVELTKIYFRRAAVGGGAGARLLEECMRFATEHGHAMIWLDVLERNRSAARFYERYGFKYCGSEPFPTDIGHELLLVMQKKLR